MDAYMSVRLGVMELRERIVLTEEWQVGSPNYVNMIDVSLFSFIFSLCI